jgi:hypothetical protein
VIKHVARGQTASVWLRALGRWTGRVEAVTSDRIAVAALAQLPDPDGILGTVAKLAVATPRGVLRTKGAVLSADRMGIVEIVVGSELELDQRREHVRVAARVPGVVGTKDPTRLPLDTYTLDVSAGGVLVAGAGPLGIGAPVSVTVKLPESDPLRAEGRIARRTEMGHAALVFDGIAERDREALVRWIFERQRLERRQARESS